MRFYYIEKFNKSWSLETVATALRINTLYMIQKAGSGHIGASLGCLDLLTWLYWEGMAEGDKFILSKGHAVPALYAVLIAKGIIPFEQIHNLRRIGGLPGHPHNSIPGIEAHTGSLAMGLSKARGMAIANRLNGKQNKVWVMVSDGEMQEGQFWESIGNGRHYPELRLIIDFNDMQTDGPNTKRRFDIGAALRAFGWATHQLPDIGGHDFGAMRGIPQHITQPLAVIAPTVKAKGVERFDEEGNGLHSGILESANYRRAVTAFAKGQNFNLIKYDGELPSKIEESDLITYYVRELYDLMVENENIVVLDADLKSDHRLEKIEHEFPDRFIECGISEQDMVSCASGLALSGKIPVCHSFACFLTSRSNEQIYNACCEGDKIIYLGSAAGWISAKGPGMSHEARRDKWLMKGMPNLEIMEPSTPKKTALALRWAVKENQKSTYIRIRQNPAIDEMLYE